MKLLKLLAIVILIAAAFPAIAVTATATAGEKEALDLLTKLATLPEQPTATSPAHNVILKERAAKALIQEWALRRANGFPTGTSCVSGIVSSAMLTEVLVEIDAATAIFADRMFGNSDGKTSLEEFMGFQEATRTNPGLRALMLMLLSK